MKVRDYNLPDDLYFHSEHTWVRVEPDGRARVGLNDFAQSTAGDITYVDLPFEGDEVAEGDTCGKIQSSKWVGKLIAPISGEIAEVNSEIENDATVINRDCYGEGWILLIQPSDLEADLARLMQGQAAADYVLGWLEKIDKEKQGG